MTDSESPNVYAPPVEPAVPTIEGPRTGGGPLATRGQRFLGSLIDGILISVGVFLPFVVSDFSLADFGANEDDPFFPYTGTGTVGLISAAWLFVTMGLNAFLVTWRGQSVGKIIVRTRIEKMDGSAPGFVHGVLLRTWLFQAIAYVPVVGNFAGLVDALLIFREDRRCGHDLIAGTQVIQVQEEVFG